jgi:hypothetical protein
MIEGRRIFRTLDLAAVFLLVEVLDATVDAEMNGLRKVLYVGRAMRACMLHDTDVAGVGDCHGDLVRKRIGDE